MVHRGIDSIADACLDRFGPKSVSPATNCSGVEVVVWWNWIDDMGRMVLPHLAVHLLSHRHSDLARLFGGQTGDRINKFDRCSWHSGPAQMPILDGDVAWFVDKTLKRIDVGDHVGFLLEPVAGQASDRVDDLITFVDVADVAPDHDA
jgi:Flavin reductase like domain